MSTNQSESEHIGMLAAENRALREAASYTLRNLDAAAEQRLITCPANFQVQLSESRKLLRAALGNTVMEPSPEVTELRMALTDLASAAARVIEDDAKPTIPHFTELNRQRRAACILLESARPSIPFPVTQPDAVKAKLIAALKPLADLDIAHFDSKPDSYPVMGSNASILTCGHIRQARAARAAGKEGA